MHSSLPNFIAALALLAGANVLYSQAVHGGGHISLPAAPATDAVPVVEDYFGTTITDKYRWLEDAKSAETRAFLEQQMAYTDRYLKQAKVGPQMTEDLDALIHVTSWSMPIQRGDSYFFQKRQIGRAHV